VFACVHTRALVYIKRECWYLESFNVKCFQCVTNFVLVRYARMNFYVRFPGIMCRYLFNCRFIITRLLSWLACSPSLRKEYTH